MQGHSSKIIVRKAGSMNTINYQEFNRSERYIVGKYDLEIPVLPKILLYNIDIKQSSTTTVQVPLPGLVTFLMSAPGYGYLFLREKNKDLQWIYNLNTSLRNESVYIQPGSYTLVFRAMNAKETIYTMTKNFDITSGGSKVVELY